MWNKINIQNESIRGGSIYYENFSAEIFESHSQIFGPKISVPLDVLLFPLLFIFSLELLTINVWTQMRRCQEC